MRIAILGATGGTGYETVAQALAAGPISSPCQPPCADACALTG